MRNKIPNITNALIINDFYHGSCDKDLMKEILKAPPVIAKQLFRDADRYITAVEQVEDLIHKR